MGLFSNKKEGGLMDVIRCDEQEYLVWKWRPSGEANSTHKENAIRYGSSLRVKEGEVAVFVYKQDNGEMQDFIVGPHDDTIKTANFPVLTNIVGLASEVILHFKRKYISSIYRETSKSVSLSPILMSMTLVSWISGYQWLFAVPSHSTSPITVLSSN